MKKPRLRALVLSAGHGNRLRPLTSFIPKPLLPVRGEATLTHTIDQLVAIGCEGVAVNLHHRGEMIRDSLGRSHGGVPLEFSIEDDLLGTLGALGPLRSFLGDAEQIVIVNGDSLCHWPLRGLVRRHVRSGAQATLLVSRRVDPEPFGGGVGVVGRKWIESLRPGKTDSEEVTRRVFMGAHMIRPALLERVPDGPANFVPDLYEPLLAEGGRLAALETSRRWHDLGTPERYRRAVLDWGARRLWVDPDAEVDAGARVRGSVVEQDVSIEDRATVRSSVLLPGVTIGEGSRVIESVIGPGVELPSNTTVERRMVTAVRADAQASKGASVVGGLVYEPI